MSCIMYNDLNPKQRKQVSSDDVMTRRLAASSGWGLDRLVNDPDEWVRYNVAAQGYGLEMLSGDPSLFVRGKVAIKAWEGALAPERCKALLEKLACDEDGYVRWKALRGDANAADERDEVSYEELSVQQRDLVDSCKTEVRAAAAYEGLGCDKLLDDADPQVRLYATGSYFTVQELEDELLSGCKLSFCESVITKLAEAKILTSKRFTPYAELDDLARKMADSKHCQVRLAAARHGWGLDKLAADPDWRVRMATRPWATAEEVACFESRRTDCSSTWAAPDGTELSFEHYRAEDGWESYGGDGLSVRVNGKTVYTVDSVNPEPYIVKTRVYGKLVREHGCEGNSDVYGWISREFAGKCFTRRAA